MSAPPDFVPEAQEVVEAFARQLLALDEQIRAEVEEVDPDLVNASFRAVHTLKGLASMSGETGIVRLSHVLESSLDALRLGKRAFDRHVLDILFEAVDAFGELLVAGGQGGQGGKVDVEALCAKIAALSESPVAPSATGIAWLDDALLGVLTEYEEHRLRENLRIGRKIFRIHASFDLLAIDVGIESLKGQLKSLGEVITYLPSADASADDRIDLDIIVGSKANVAELAAVVAADPTVSVIELGGSEAKPAGRGGSSGPATSGGSAGASSAPASTPRAAPGRAGDPDHAVRTSMGDADRGRVEPDAAPPAALAARAGPRPRVEVSREDDDGEGEVADTSLRSLAQTVRVDLRRLDLLMNLVGELGLVHANLGTLLDELRGTDGRSELYRAMREQVRLMNRRLDLLQQGILDVRMVPLGQVFDKLARVVRKLGREAGKEIRLTVSGADTELDKLIVEELSDPLMHMIRNAIDHGIEFDRERAAAGKQPWGRIDLRAFQKGNRVVIEVEDDGRGMDWRAIRDTAVARSFMTRDEGAEVSPQQALNMIFRPGFSTRAQASELSGRGVGMDVVKTNIARLSGMIDVHTEPGRGTRFSITLPVTLAIIQALVVEAAGQTYCIPLNAVLESIMVQRHEISTIEGHQVVTLRGRTLPLVRLSYIFDLDAAIRTERERLYVVVVGLAQHRVGLVVDELLGQQDVVIKTLGKALRQVPGIAGATELGANRTVLLLDVGGLVAEAIASDRGGEGRTTAAPPGGPHVWR